MGKKKVAALVCVSSLPLPLFFLFHTHTHSPSLLSLLSLAAPAVIAGCSQVKSYYRSEEFSITPHPIKAQLACERWRRGKKKLLWKQPNQHSFNCRMCFYVNIFTPCSVFNTIRKKKVLGLYFSNTLKRKAHPTEEPLAILRRPLPGEQAIKPYTQSRKKR